MATQTETQTRASVKTGDELPRYMQPEESSHDLDWADLITLDLSKFDQPGGKQLLANQLKDAVHNIGFFYITNFGLSQEHIDRQFAIGKSIFDLSMNEKLRYRADLDQGNYSGCRPLGASEIKPGLKDNVEMYSVFKVIPEPERSQPDVVKAHRDEIERFQRHIAQDTVQKLLALIAIILELPETALQDGHSFTLLFRQPIAALQVQLPDKTWKWVKPHPASITVNIADVLQFWTAGYLKSSIHRVVAPPEDQAHLDRLGLLYFLRPAQDLDLRTLGSPVLQRMGLVGEKGADGIRAGDWVRARVKEVFEKAVVEGSRTEKEVLGGVRIGFMID